MRIMKAVSVLALALVSGCGGCESCIGKPGAEDAGPEPVATTTTTATAKPDAAVDAGPPRDAAAEAGPAPTAVNLLRDADAPLLRPKAPMPLGAFQSCGVYDGPVCEKKCDKGACRQECDGVECVLTCAGGYCSQLCQIDGKCRMTCAGGHCTQACTKAESCTKECAGGSCQ